VVVSALLGGRAAIARLGALTRATFPSYRLSPLATGGPGRSKPRRSHHGRARTERRVTLSRDRRIITRKRNKLTIVAAAGALSVATAASAVAAWPSGQLAGTGTAFASVNQAGAPAAEHGPSLRQANLAVAHFRARAGHQAMLTALAEQQAGPQAVTGATTATPAATKAAKATKTAPKTAASPSATASSTPTTSPVPAAAGSPQSIAQAMLKSFGWSSSQFACLEPLWEHESGWSVSASNPSTGAYGIPQASPGSKMASAGPDWKTNASTQIKWGLGYIKDTYGSPCAAESHEQAVGWY
jgi:hypothetical protein